MYSQKLQDNIANKRFNALTLNSASKFVLPKIKDLYLFTINYKTAPVPIREKFAIQEYILPTCNKFLKQCNSISAFLILSTCNRTEIYFTASDLNNALSSIYELFAKELKIEEKVVKEYNNLISNDDVVHHAFKLACGLDSFVMGERQILSQVKHAYSISQKEKALENTLELLFQSVISSAKDVHKITNLSKNSQSISSAAIDLANSICGPIKTKSVMVLGAGKMAKLALEHILKIGGAKETVVLNKSPHRVIEFADKYKIDKSIPFENVYETINDIDILIVATGAPHFILFAEQFKPIRKDTGKELFIFDISLPRNIEPEFGRLPNIKLFDIDSLQSTYNQINTSISNEDLNNAELIISSGITRFYEQVNKKELNTLIKDIKQEVEAIRTEKLRVLTENKISFTKEEVDYITQNIINTILHKPVKNLKDSNPNGSLENKSDVLRELFNL